MGSIDNTNSVKMLSYLKNETLYKKGDNNYYTVANSGKITSYPKEKGIQAENFIKTTQQEINRKSILATTFGLTLSIIGLYKFAPKMGNIKKVLITGAVTLASFLAGVFIPLKKALNSNEWKDICNAVNKE